VPQRFNESQKYKKIYRRQYPDPIDAELNLEAYRKNTVPADLMRRWDMMFSAIFYKLKKPGRAHVKLEIVVPKTPSRIQE